MTATTAGRDLAQYHHLVGDLFQQPKTADQWDAYKLRPEQVDFFHEHGYLAGVKLLDDWQLDVLSHDLAGLMKSDAEASHLFYEYHSNESNDPSAVLFHALGAWRITEGFHDVLWNPRFIMAASQLLGDVAVRFWHDQLFCKPAKQGGVVAWHQDYSYWTRTVPMQHLTCWCGLDDATIENGCLQYVPGSHKWGLIDKPELAGDMEGINRFLDEQQRAAFKPVAIELEKGSAAFHHPLMVHGSYPNSSDTPRRAFVINVFADGTRSDTDETILKGVPVIATGKKMEGTFFPLLFAPQPSR